eukprot:8833562-Alexandrium_andersonii.AAC.1
MSASLVGSEMCIRDSGRRVCGRSPRAIFATLPPRGHRSPHRGHRIGDAVSYTHLTLPTICSV